MWVGGTFFDDIVVDAEQDDLVLEIGVLQQRQARVQRLPIVMLVIIHHVPHSQPVPVPILATLQIRTHPYQNSTLISHTSLPITPIRGSALTQDALYSKKRFESIDGSLSRPRNENLPIRASDINHSVTKPQILGSQRHQKLHPTHVRGRLRHRHFLIQILFGGNCA